MSTSRTALIIAPPVGADGARGAWLRSALQAQAGTMQTARQVALIALGGYGRDMVARRNHDPSAARVSSADQRVARELVALLGDGRPRGRFELRGEDGRAAPLSGPMLPLLERHARLAAVCPAAEGPGRQGGGYG